MSLAGLGLSLSHGAQARSDLQVEPGLETMPWLAAEPPGGPITNDDVSLSLPAGPLDASLSNGPPAAPMSEEDRAAIALAMVLMADPPWAPAIASMPAVPITTARWEFSDAFRRDFEDVVAVPVRAEKQAARVAAMVRSSADRPIVERPAPGEDEETEPVATIAEAATTTPVPTVDIELEPPFASLLDLNLEVGSDLDLNLDLSAGLDLNLDLSPGLDLNLDLGSQVDLPLDRPPVFPVTRLKPAAKRAMGPVAKGSSVSDLESNPDSTSVPSPVVSGVRFGVGETRETVAPVALVTVPIAAVPPLAQRDLGVTPANISDRLPRAKSLPKIVVASHADRIIHSLEALLSSDDPLTSRFGAQPEEIFVASHAERALLTLASVCSRGDVLVYLDFDAPAQGAHSAVASSPAATSSRPPDHANPLGDRAVAINERGLDKIRGGFTTPSGLQMSFGIERAVYVNGALVTTTTLNLSDLGKITGGQSSVASAVSGTSSLALIQNGPGNTFSAGPISAATVGTVVQNTLNDQKIQSITSINAAVNSLQMVRAQNFQSSLRGALIDSLRR